MVVVEKIGNAEKRKTSHLQFFPVIIIDDISKLFYANMYFEKDYTGQNVLELISLN